MSKFTFHPAVRQRIPLIIGLAGGTGSGKTFSALTLAKGLAGGQKFALIDTEAGRALHYADQFDFDHGDLGPPFRPERYAEAIAAADAANYPVIVVDSMSHEYAGEGGILDWQEEEFAAANHREAMRMASWIKPKMAHKQFVSRLLQVRAHLILCFRAEPKIEVVREDGRMQVVEKVGAGGFKGWLPVTEKNFPYELTASVLLMAECPGVPQPIKMPESLRGYFPTDKPISERAGQQLAQWAAGGTVAKTPGEEFIDAVDAEFREVAPRGRLKAKGAETVPEDAAWEQIKKALDKHPDFHGRWTWLPRIAGWPAGAESIRAGVMQWIDERPAIDPIPTIVALVDAEVQLSQASLPVED